MSLSEPRGLKPNSAVENKDSLNLTCLPPLGAKGKTGTLLLASEINKCRLEAGFLFLGDVLYRERSFCVILAPHFEIVEVVVGSSCR